MPFKTMCDSLKMFSATMTFLNFNPSNVNSLECVSMNNQECKTRTKIININNNEHVFYPFSIKVNKFSGSCKNTNDPYARLCVPDVIKDINVTVFNLVSWSNQTKHIEWDETCKCKCRLDASVCNNEDKCRCECREKIDKGMCDKGLIWNPSNCNCECDKSCDIAEYLDYKTIIGDYKRGSCILYMVLFVVILVISVIIVSVFIYLYRYSKKNITSFYY